MNTTCSLSLTQTTKGGAVVGFCGNATRPSKSRALVEAVIDRISVQYGLASEVYDLVDALPELGTTIGDVLPHKVAQLIEVIQQARVLVVGTPVYKGSYTGLFKHFFDLVEPIALAGIPIVLTATGGGERHALVVEHQLRPLFSFFTAHCAPNAIYASAKDFANNTVISPVIHDRIDCAVTDLRPWLDANNS